MEKDELLDLTDELNSQGLDALSDERHPKTVQKRCQEDIDEIVDVMPHDEEMGTKLRLGLIKEHAELFE
jgi:hypothetical protein